MQQVILLFSALKLKFFQPMPKKSSAYILSTSPSIDIGSVFNSKSMSIFLKFILEFYFYLTLTFIF